MKSIRSAFTRPTPITDVTVEPLPCAFPFSAEADGLHYCWRGEGPNKKSTSLSVYECCTELWTLMPTTGPAHPGTSEGCSVCIGTFLFLYGGWNGSKYFNDMSKLDLNTLQWSTVQTTGSQPIRKFGCGLVRVDERTLCCIGGYGKGPKQPGSKFCRNFDYFDGTGWTDEINLFDVQDGNNHICLNFVHYTHNHEYHMGIYNYIVHVSVFVPNSLPGNWSVPEFRGERPPPCSNFTFTKVDQYRAVYFGGMVAGGHMVNTLYLIDFRSMVRKFLFDPTNYRL